MTKVKQEYVPHIVTTVQEASTAVSKILEVCHGSLCVMDCEGINLSATGELTLIQVAFCSHNEVDECVLFDVKSMSDNQGGGNYLDAMKGGGNNCLDVMKPLLEGDVWKVLHDVHMDAAALSHQFNCGLNKCIDTQLVMEFFTGKMLGSIGGFLDWCEVPPHPNKAEVRRMLDSNPEVWGKRPLPPSLVKYAAADVLCLLEAVTRSKRALVPMFNADTELRKMIIGASRARCQLDPCEAKKRQVGFGKLPTGDRMNMQSWELLRSLDPSLDHSHGQVEIEEDIQDLLGYIPPRFHDFINKENYKNEKKIRDIIFEIDKQPYAYFGSQNRVYLGEEPNMKINREEMVEIVVPLKNKFGKDNRAGIQRSLHRISAMRAKDGEIYSLTYRVGRAAYGNAGIVKDILLASEKSVLIMGCPGTGKTTVIREIANQLSEDQFNVVIVDTSNEICGDGLIPHRSVGMARRMMVPSLDQQAEVLVEAVQNHTPDVIICDEIGRVEEVEAMQTVKERGVRCVASAHGDLRSLVRNKQLRGLVGGVETVTLGDAQAKHEQRRFGVPFSKVRQQRCSTPVFDVVVELKPNNINSWTIIPDVAMAVDRILAAKSYKAQIRRRNPDTGAISLELVDS